MQELRASAVQPALRVPPDRQVQRVSEALKASKAKPGLKASAVQPVRFLVAAVMTSRRHGKSAMTVIPTTAMGALRHAKRKLPTFKPVITTLVFCVVMDAYFAGVGTTTVSLEMARLAEVGLMRRESPGSLML